MNILGIDPGTEKSAWVCLSWHGDIIKYGYDRNENVKYICKDHQVDIMPNQIAIEMIASYGMPVGRETFETCLWIGRFIECVTIHPMLVYRKDIKMHLCGSMKAKDGNIRQALIDRLGPQGTKKSPGPTFGISSHIWSALAVAVYAQDTAPAKTLMEVLT